jgi:hypothetical protein
MICPVCNSATPDSSRFCNGCGALLAATAAGSAPAAPPATPRVDQTASAFATSDGSGVPGAFPDALGLVQRILNITLKPKVEWPVIAAELPSMGRVMLGCVIPLAALQALLSFVRMAVIGVSVPFAGTVRMPVAGSLGAAITGFVFALIGVFALALIVNVWAPFFAGRRSVAQALKVAAYAAVPGWLGSFFVILPFGTLLGLLAGLYAVYVLYLGLPIVMRAPKERALGYTVAVILTGIVVGVVLGGLSLTVGGLTRWAMPEHSAQAQADQGAAITGNIIGNLLGTDDKGKAALGQALGNLARAGREMPNANPMPTAPERNPTDSAARAQQQEATQTGNTIGGMLGTDQQGRAALGQALGRLARAGQQAQSATAAQDGNAPPAAAAAGNPDPSANAGAAVGGLLTALGGALGGSHRVTPVDFRTLQALLPPAVNGMPRGSPQGENREALGVKASSASASYGGAGAGTIHIKISDVSGVSGLIDIAGNLDHTTDAQTATGFERDTTIAGRSVHEKYSNANRSGELQAIVGKRFEVDVDGSGIDIATLEEALARIDLSRLESMKNAGAQN